MYVQRWEQRQSQGQFDRDIDRDIYGRAGDERFRERGARSGKEKKLYHVYVALVCGIPVGWHVGILVIIFFLSFVGAFVVSLEQFSYHSSLSFVGVFVVSLEQFVIEGYSSFNNKIFKNYCLKSNFNLFNCIIYHHFFIFIFFLSIEKKQKFRKLEVVEITIKLYFEIFTR